MNWNPRVQLIQICMPMRATPTRRKRCRAGIILLKCRNSETCNKKEKTPFHDHLEYLPIQNPLSGRVLGLGRRGGGGAH